jgi:glycerophosphoryl diester phosphodiesterase
MSHWPHPRVLAHRGGGKLAPENTLGAIRFAASLGFKGVEFDVMLAGDGTPVLMHDQTLTRTAGGVGQVATTPYREIAELDAGHWHGPKWRGERVPRFEDAARLCHELGLWRGAGQLPLLSSFSPVALAAARSVAPEIPRGLLVGRVPPQWREMLHDLECFSFHCNHRALNQRLADAVHVAGYALLCWTVNDRRSARKLLRWGVDCLVTDALKRIGPRFA